MSTLHFLPCTFLMLMSGLLSAYSVEVSPPEVPNPYGTSEGRAIRDHLEEIYKVKVSDKLSLEELRAIYSKTWNADQEKRYFKELGASSADPTWVKAYLSEQEGVQRAKWSEVLQRMGVQVPEGVSAEEMRDLAAKTEKERALAAEAARNAENDKRRDEMAKQIEREATLKRDAVKQTSRGQEQVFTPILNEKEIMSDARIITAYKLNSKRPTDTQAQRDDIDRRARRLIADRDYFKSKDKGKPLMTNSAGVEVWYALQISALDPEIAWPKFFILNTTQDSYDCVKIDVSFVGSKRNAPQSYSPNYGTTDRLDTKIISGEKIFVDAGQTVSIDAMTFSVERE